AHTPHGGIEIGVITATIADSAESSSPGLTWLAVVYLAGAAAALLLTAITAVRLTRLIRRGRHIRCNGYTVVLTDSPSVSPFSWGRYMVMSEADYCGAHSLIALHERAHIERHHWLDLLAGQLVAIFQWYNPAAWLMREELKALHEYQADDAVLRSGADARAYQMLLIKKAVGARFPSLANSLNHSKLKKRITMMYKQKSSTRRRLLRAAALVPALAAAVALFQVPQVARAIGAVSEITLSADAVKADDMPLKAMPAPDRKVTIISENNETAGMAVSASQTTKVAVVADNKADIADEPVSVSAVMPEFPGGMQALMNYLSQNLRFPKDADCATGRVVVKFVVTKTGKVSDVSILKSVGPEVDAEALRVVNSLPDFIPGKNEDGKTVSVYYALPINFTTTGGDDSSEAATP
ncbi:MAG: M56 family metallopeptidase, partial [Muribaculaceae bacterium]|nr:M56 family metallopeptidase [Muribaculaceae bacterium]